MTARLKFLYGLHDLLTESSGSNELVAGLGFGNADRCAGDYLTTQRHYSGPQALASWWKWTLTFEADDHGRLYRREAPDARFAEVEPLVFKELGGPREIVFCENAGGEIDHMFLVNFTHEAYERLPRCRTPRFVTGVLRVVTLCAVTLYAALRF